jgi:hypothetical protein
MASLINICKINIKAIILMILLCAYLSSVEANAKIIKKIEKKERISYNLIETIKQAHYNFQENIKLIDPKKAINIYSTSIAPIKEDNTDIYLLLIAKAYLETGDCKHSTQLYSLYISINPKHYRGYLGQAISNQLCGKYKDALISYEKTRIIIPKKLITIEIIHQIKLLYKKLNIIQSLT